jgi:hypothetical protein
MKYSFLALTLPFLLFTATPFTSASSDEAGAVQECKCAVKRHYKQSNVAPIKGQWDAIDLEHCSDFRNRNSGNHIDVYARGNKYRDNSVCE